MCFASISFLALIDCRMREKIKTGISILIILILFPYVAVVFRTGSMSGLEASAKETDLEALVAEILPAQMPVTYEEEALGAQAVIIRTNLLRKAMEYYGCESAREAAEAVRQADLETMGFSFYTDEEQLRLWGYESCERYTEKCRLAAEATAGKILTLEDGSLPDLPYHAVSAGKTREGSVLGETYSYLESAECPGDLESADYLKVQLLSMTETPEILARDGAGYVTEVRAEGELLAGEELRSRLGLNSSCFTAEQTKDGVRVTTKGLGHGLGLSMYQANLLALEGQKYQEILSYFYKNTECISFS